jgi:hypothetical protein
MKLAVIRVRLFEPIWIDQNQVCPAVRRRVGSRKGLVYGAFSVASGGPVMIVVVDRIGIELISEFRQHRVGAADSDEEVRAEFAIPLLQLLHTAEIQGTLTTPDRFQQLFVVDQHWDRRAITSGR